MSRPLKLFVRQPFTQGTAKEQAIIEDIIKLIDKLESKDYPLEFLTGKQALCRDTFRQSWENKTGEKFSAKKFRQDRLNLLSQADVFINLRMGLSESTSFEIAYNVFHKKIPMFFAIWQDSPIKTTLLQELDDLCSVQYHTFDDPKELYQPLKDFIYNNTDLIKTDSDNLNSVA